MVYAYDPLCRPYCGSNLISTDMVILVCQNKTKKCCEYEASQ
jgi:hypothetical protein